jgi:hypothetical protein
MSVPGPLPTTTPHDPRMTTDSESRDVVDLDVYRCTGERIGRANSVYIDHRSRRPAWVGVTTGLFATHQSVIPLTDAAITRDRITVVFSKEHIRDSPTVEPVDTCITPRDERSLNAHYGLSPTG